MGVFKVRNHLKQHQIYFYILYKHPSCQYLTLLWCKIVNKYKSIFKSESFKVFVIKYSFGVLLYTHQNFEWIHVIPMSVPLAVLILF